MSDRRTSFLLDSTELASEVTLPTLPTADGPASWTTSQGDYGEVGIGTLEDDGDMQDSDDPDTTDNFDQEQDESQYQDHDEEDDLEVKMDELYQQLQEAKKEKEEAENSLEAYRNRDVGNTGNNELNRAEERLQAIIERVAEISLQLDYYKERAFDPPSFGYLPDEVLKDSQQPIQVLRGRSHSNSISTSEYADNEDDRQSVHSAVADIMTSLRSLLDSPAVRLEHLTNLVNILKQNQYIHPGYPMQELVSCLRFCLASTLREIRLNAYRCLRLLSGVGPLGPVLTAYKIDIFIIRTLMGDHRTESERIEALKLVRCFVATKESMQHISDGVMRAVIAIAEQSDERLRNACLETLGEMVMSDPKPVARCGGFRAILTAVTDNLQDLSDALLKVFLFMLESPETRIYVRQGLDSETVMSVFTDIYSQGPSYNDRVKASGRIVTSMVRSWPGLFDLCTNDKRAIRSLVQSIKLPMQENRKVLLDMLYEIFRIQTPRWLKDFLEGKGIKPSQEDLDSYWGSNLQPLGLVDHHQSVVLTVFIDAGLIEALVSLVVDSSRLVNEGDADAVKVLRKATLLIPELMQLSYKVLPPDKSTHVQTLPSLFQVATNFEDPVLRHIATSAFRFIDTLSRTSRGIAAERLDDGRGQRNLDRIKQRIGTQMDDANFRTLLNDTQVLATKDVSRWKWNLILEIIQGPMLNPRRMDEAIRGTKFSKRLLGFYRPLNHWYSNQPASESQTHTKIGCALFETLANSIEGAKYLAQNKILRLIADGLAQLDPVQGHSGSDPIFSREKMETTMTSGYFEMLGTLCKSRSGSRLLEKFKIFNLYYQLSELRSRDDIVKKIITSMDYSMDGHPRVILSKIMTSGYKHIRLYATQHLGTVIKSDRNEFNDWGIRLLCTQLCDPSQDVCHMAVRALDDACTQRKNLDLLIRLRPNLDHLGEAGNPLLLRFLSTSKGFQYLQDTSYIEEEMDDWSMFANRQYMIQTEVKLARAMELQRFNPFSEDGKFENEAGLQLARAKQVLQPHFYGELTRTEEGCKLLKKKGHFADYARYIREHCAESKDPTIISKLKSILWAVGNIGSTVGGLPFLEEEDLIKYIVGMAERSKVLSLKGTCFYVLGLMCKTTQGIEILEDYGWQGILHRDRTPRGLCLPKDLGRFLEVPRWNQYREVVPRVVIPLATEGDSVEKEVLRSTGELGNHILTNGASKNLAKLKAEHPVYFSSVALYTAVLDLLSHYHFRLPVRRFILGLFDVKLEEITLERPNLVGGIAAAAALSPIATTASFRESSDVVGNMSFDSPTRTMVLNEILSSTPRSPFAVDASQGPALSLLQPLSPTPLSSPAPPSPAPPQASVLTNDELQSQMLVATKVPKKVRTSPAHIDVIAANRSHMNTGSSGWSTPEPNLDISPTLTLSQPPIPPPRPPPHAYEILYTNKPYHKNFAKEAGLAPLPPRVKVMVLGLEDEDDPMPTEARQSAFVSEGPGVSSSFGGI